MKKFFSFLLAVILIFSSLTVSFAAPTSFKFFSIPKLFDFYSPFERGDGNYLFPYNFSNSNYATTFLSLLESNNYYFLVRFCPVVPNFFVIYFIPRNIRLTFGEKDGNYSGQKLYTLSSASYFYLISFRFNSSTGFFDNVVFNSQCKSFSLYDSSSAFYFFDSTDFFSKYSSSIPSSVSYLNDISNIFFVDGTEYPPLPINYTLTVNYLYAEGVPAAPPVTQTIAAGEKYSIPSPEITGYAPSIPVVSGTMPDEDLTVDVYYAKSFYDLQVQYQYPDGTEAAPEVAFQYPAGFVYDIPSPEISGYRPDKPSVSGAMPGEALTVTVTYHPVYLLTINYRFPDGSPAAEPYQSELRQGDAYSIPSLAVAGYQPDRPSVFGEMPGKAVTETVTYSPIPYTLTVNYRFVDGTAAAESHREQHFVGDSYSVSSPVIPGYHPNQSSVTGVMPARDVTSTVTYREDSGGSGGTGPAGPGGGGGSGGGGGDSGGGNSGDDPFIPVLPPASGNDPFIVPQPPPYSGPDPFLVPEPPPYPGYDPFLVKPPPPWSGYDPFAIPNDSGG